MPGQTLHGIDGASHGLFADLRSEQSVSDGGEQLVDVIQFHSLAGAYDQIQIVVLGMPDGRTGRVAADVEVVVLVAFVTRD